jgi:hypothetical protein
VIVSTPYKHQHHGAEQLKIRRSTHETQAKGDHYSSGLLPMSTREDEGSYLTVGPTLLQHSLYKRADLGI